MKKKILTRAEKATALLADVISQGAIVYVSGSSGDVTVGPYTEAVDRGVRYAVLAASPAVARKLSDRTFKHELETAGYVVDNFGVGNVIDGLKAVKSRHGKPPRKRYQNLDTPMVI